MVGSSSNSDTGADDLNLMDWLIRPSLTWIDLRALDPSQSRVYQEKCKNHNLNGWVKKMGPKTTYRIAEIVGDPNSLKTSIVAYYMRP